MFIGLLPLLILVVLGVGYFQRHRDAPSRARFLRLTAFGFIALVAVVFGAFIVAETIDDPGGLAAAGLIASWLVPLIGLAVLAWSRPDVAVRVFVVLTVLVLVMTAWAAVQSDAWRSFEDRNGPVRTVAVFLMTAAVAVLGLRRPRQAGWLLVTLGVLPLVVSSLGGRLALGSLAAAVTPALIVGVGYLAAAHLADGSAPEPPVHPRRRLLPH